MADIFISHSRLDTRMTFFQKAFSRAHTKGTWMEYENPLVPPWAAIRSEIWRSRAVFVVLSEPMLDPGFRHTQNWIDFEVGLACMQNKDLWVFEPADHPIDFAVPYATHQMLFNSASVKHQSWLRERIEAYNKLVVQFDRNLRVTCTNENCKLQFFQVNGEGEFCCPSCRTPHHWEPSQQ